MAFANFFDKAALSITSVLRGIDLSGLREILERQVVGIAFDNSAVQRKEGRWALELTVDLAARLYPRLAISAIESRPSAEALRLQEELRQRVAAINPDIEFEADLAVSTVVLVVGDSALAVDLPTFHLGSAGWLARVSSRRPVGSGDTDIPFGAGVAACFAAAAAFRSIFHGSLEGKSSPEEQILGLPPSSSDRHASSQHAVAGPALAPDATGIVSRQPYEVNLSVLDMSLLDECDSSVSAEQSTMDVWTQSADSVIDIGDTTLVGLGAIGNAVIWALCRSPRLRGTLNLVDGEQIELTNLQRYVLATQGAIGAPKASFAKDVFESERAFTNEIVVLPNDRRWQDHVSTRGSYSFDRVLLALDSAEDRISVQGALPRWVANAWTQPENCGVSRHEFIGNRPCVVCLYLPAGQRKSRDVLYAEALGAQSQDELMEIRTLLHSGRPVGHAFIERLASRFGAAFKDLEPFAGDTLEVFYTNALCGGLVLRLGGHTGNASVVEVPIAFQSALAGLLLAAELISDAGGLRETRLAARTEVNLLSPEATRFLSPAGKHPMGRCICQDPVYQTAYSRKYQS